jgi:C-terminal processing protease CtpA/Prc
LTGQKGELDALKKEVATSEVDPKVKAYVTEEIEATRKGLSEKRSWTDEILGEFLGDSRQGDYRLGVKIVAHESGIGNVVREVIPGSKAEEFQFAAGDVILSINGQVARDPLATREFVMGTTGNLNVLKYRYGQFLEVEVIFDVADPGQGQGSDGTLLLYKKVRMVNSKAVRRPAWVPRSLR